MIVLYSAFDGVLWPLVHSTSSIFSCLQSGFLPTSIKTVLYGTSCCQSIYASPGVICGVKAGQLQNKCLTVVSDVAPLEKWC